MTESRAPGRICLFGEHQDYLGHPVIAAAIDRFFVVRGQARPGPRILVHMPDLGQHDSFDLPVAGRIPYVKPRDYFRSCVNVVRQAGLEMPHGAEVEVTSTIPIEAGASSSSALCVAWVRFLAELHGAPWRGDPVRVAELAFHAEVSEFGEPGGRMDHYASALGGVQFLDFAGEGPRRLRDQLDGFVLVDTRVKKDTLGMLKRIKHGELAALAAVRARFPGGELAALGDGELDFLPPDLRPWGLAAVGNHRLTLQGRDLLAAEPLDAPRLGGLFNQQQRILREQMRNTTPLIDRLHEAALASGALGGKMNGSGGGGTVFFYAPGREEAVCAALRGLGVRADPIAVGLGDRAAPDRSGAGR